jgi:hypothetical protein
MPTWLSVGCTFHSVLLVLRTFLIYVGNDNFVSLQKLHCVVVCYDKESNDFSYIVCDLCVCIRPVYL